jgi:hypothetical protein
MESSTIWMRTQIALVIFASHLYVWQHGSVQASGAECHRVFDEGTHPLAGIFSSLTRP